MCVWLLQACTELCTRDLVRRTLGDEAHAVLLLLCGDIAHLQSVQDGHWHAVLHEHWYTLLHASLLYAKACVAYKRSGLSHLIARCYADTGGVVGEGKARRVTHTHLWWPGQQLDQVGSRPFVSSDLAGRVVSCVLSSLAGNAAAPLRLLIELDQVWAAAHLADLLHHNKVRCCCSFLRFAAHHHVCAQHPIWPRRRWRCKSASQAGALASVSTCCWSWPRSSRHSPPCGSLPLAMQRMHSAPVARDWPTPSCTMLHLHQTGWRTSLQPCSAGTPKSTKSGTCIPLLCSPCSSTSSKFASDAAVVYRVRGTYWLKRRRFGQAALWLLRARDSARVGTLASQLLRLCDSGAGALLKPCDSKRHHRGLRYSLAALFINLCTVRADGLHIVDTALACVPKTEVLGVSPMLQFLVQYVRREGREADTHSNQT